MNTNTENLKDLLKERGCSFDDISNNEFGDYFKTPAGDIRCIRELDRRIGSSSTFAHIARVFEEIVGVKL